MFPLIFGLTILIQNKDFLSLQVLVDDRGLMRLDPEMDPTLVQKHRELSGLLHAMYLDVACRFLFPICFGVFNLVYWTIYTADNFHNHG